MIRCPYCGMQIKSTAQKCRYCGHWLAQGQNAQQPQPNSNLQSTTSSHKKDLSYLYLILPVIAILIVVIIVVGKSKNGDDTPSSEYSNEVVVDTSSPIYQADKAIQDIKNDLEGLDNDEFGAMDYDEYIARKDYLMKKLDEAIKYRASLDTDLNNQTVPTDDTQLDFANKILSLANKSFGIVEHRISNEATGFNLSYVETIEKYYNDFVDDPSSYEGSVRHYSGDGISIYLNDTRREFSIYIEKRSGFEKFVSQIVRMGYTFDEKEEGARGEAWVYTKGKNSICIWCGGGAFPGYSVSIY